MKLLKNDSETVHYTENLIDIDECKYWISLSKKIPKHIRSQYNYPSNELWDYRTVNITQSHIVGRVQKFLNEKFNFNLMIDEAQIQNWIDGSFSPLHTHLDCPMRGKNKFNSILYLNDDFDGGDFYTKGNISIKPKPGLLTMFDGNNIEHGVKQISNGDRYSIIFWWNL